MKLIKEDILTEMALDRPTALDRCISLGEQFIKHFDKIYLNRNSEAVNHWIEEMQNWFSSIKKITLKYNNKPLLDGQIRDWFFTAGSNPDIITPMTDDEIIAYDSFCSNMFITLDVKKSLENIEVL